jgi:uncharacterized protein YjiS (DUF1127 family)
MTVAIALLFMRIIKLLARLKQVIETELAVRHAISELSDMSDYMLRDLGITRGEIERVVRRPDALTGRYEGLGAKTSAIVPGIIANARRSDDSVRSLPPRAAA